MKPIHIGLKLMGVRVLLGSGGEEGRKAANDLVDLLRHGWSTAISPDGPHGPQGVLKSGVLHIALQSGVPILPVRFIASRTFALPSWDKKPLPLPFSSITVVLGEPIAVGESNFEEAAKLLTDRMTHHWGPTRPMQPVSKLATDLQHYASYVPSWYPLDYKLQHIYNVIINSIRYFWDDRKNAANQKKHRVSFEEAQSGFFDEHAVEYYDPDHSESEDRFLMLGFSYQLRVLVVSYALREQETEIRLISARKATKKEQKVYTGGRLWGKNTIFQKWKDVKILTWKGWRNK
jgi:uncharacterized DUF497 family protein